MLFDWMLDIYEKMMKAFVDSMPKGNSAAAAVPDFIMSWATNIFYYIDLSPILVVLLLAVACFTGFALFKLAVFVYRLIPLIG